MSALVFAYPGNETLAHSLVAAGGLELGGLTLHNFPDGETCVRIGDDVRGKAAIIACTLNNPDTKTLTLYFIAQTLRDLGATRVVLAAPYLAYMRQDRQFHPGEGIAAKHFATLLSAVVDDLITVDPHLHRIHSLSEIYSIRTHVVAAAPAISAWVAQNVPSPLLIGPDAESEQWVREVARGAGSPFLVLEKQRSSDSDVRVSIPDLALLGDRTPVLIDDIISTGHTMIEAAKSLAAAGARRPICLGVHAIFAGRALAALRDAGAARVATCNTIAHETNAIDVAPLIARELSQLLQRP